MSQAKATYAIYTALKPRLIEKRSRDSLGASEARLQRLETEVGES
jgi:hypothetical protein